MDCGIKAPEAGARNPLSIRLATVETRCNKCLDRRLNSDAAAAAYCEPTESPDGPIRTVRIRDSVEQSSETSDDPQSWRRELPLIESNSIASDPAPQSP